MGFEDEYHEYCPNCDADLTMQQGYSNDLPYWICRGCGEMLINPDAPCESDIVWRCDGCGAMLNIQPGFHDDCGQWICTECGFENRISADQLYLSEAELHAALENPYRGLSDQAALALSLYQEERLLGMRNDIILVSHVETGRLYVKKLLSVYNKEVYEYLKKHPIAYMPRIIELYEGSNRLIVIEEYIPGYTLEEYMKDGPIGQDVAVEIVLCICRILNKLHNLPRPIIHRDVKPANIILSNDYKVYLLDMNVAKWYDPNQSDDTSYMGTPYYAAPEQIGYGLSASSAKTDIYAVGMLLNRLITGHFPKEKRAPGEIWTIIERCISLEAEKRYTSAELIEALEEFRRS